MKILKPTIAAALAAAVVISAAPTLAQKNASDAARTADAAQGASRQQAEAIAKMAELLRKLGATDAIEAARTELAGIRAEQNRLIEAADGIKGEAAGKNPQDLPEDVKRRLDDLASAQARLAERSEKLIEGMKDAAERLKQSDPAVAETLKNTANIGTQTNVPAEQKNAGASLAKNQLSSGSSSQNRALAGLTQMQNELDQITARQLQELERQLAQLLEQVKTLKLREETLHGDTMKPDANLLSKLGDRQQTLQANALVTSKLAEATPNAQEAASDIRVAAEHMGTAAGKLYANKSAEAVLPEERAIASLAAAIAKLQKQHDEVANKLKDEDLAAFVKAYEAIRTSQKEVKTGSEALAKNRGADNQLDRKGMLEAARLTAAQSELAKKIAALSSDERLKEYDVVIWMNAQIAGAMDQSKADLSKGQTGERLSTVQQTAIARLTDLIDALKEEKQRSEDSFANNDAPGESGSPTGAPEKKPLLPPLAQLKLVRAMQGTINEQTATVHSALKLATEDAERSRLRGTAARLGETQGQLKTIVERIVPKSN